MGSYTIYLIEANMRSKQVPNLFDFQPCRCSAKACQSPAFGQNGQNCN